MLRGINHILLILLLLVGNTYAQWNSFEMNGKDTINKVDANDMKQGKWIITNKIKNLPDYEEDQKIEEGTFKDNKKVGIWKEYYPNNALKNKITFENGRPNGYAIMYHDNGKISEEGLWKNNRWVGNYKLYYENGQVAQEFSFNNSGKREGQQKYFYENGQLMIEGNWQEGKEAGIVKEYYQNGDIRSEKNFNDGNMDVATSKTYEPKKPLPKEEPDKPKDPIESAPKIEVKQDEKPNLPTQVFNGEGHWTLYNKNRQVSKDGEFSKGRLMEGKVFHYSEDGILKRIAIYKNGIYVGDTPIEDQ